MTRDRGRAGRRFGGLALALALASTAAGCGPEAPARRPYAFDAAREQRYRLLGNDTTRIDGSDVEVERIAELRLEGKPLEDGGLELVLRLSRFYLRVDGAPGGPTEFVISEKGLVTRGGTRGDLRIAPDSPEAQGPIARILEDPLGGVLLDSSGRQRGTPWFSRNPVLAGVDLIEWVVLALPVLSPPGEESWSAARALPPIGQYRLGLELPLQYTRELDATGAAQVRATGLVRRDDLAVAEGLRGTVQVDFASEAQLAPDDRLVGVRLQLTVHFAGGSGTLVQSRHQLRLECLDCGVSINPAPEESDTSAG